jgi:hypothetical protein
LTKVLYVVTAVSVANKAPQDRATGAVAKASIHFHGNGIVSIIYQPCRGSCPVGDRLAPDETNLKE